MSLGVVFPVCAAARLALALANPFDLTHDHQLTSPLTAYSNLQEGIYLFKHGINPYFGGVFRLSPLYLSLFTTVLPESRTFAAILWTLIDILGAYAMVQIWRARQGVSASQRDGLISALYLLNPYLFLPNLALSTSSIETTLVLISIMFACRGRASQALLSMAFLLHISLSSILFVPPLILLLLSDPYSHLASPRPFFKNQNKDARNSTTTLSVVGEFLLYFAALTFVSCLVSGGTSWISQTWGASLTLPDLTPNIGVWWYFFTEMFDHFRPFFLMVFSVHLLIYIAPICIKFQHDMLYATFLLAGILGTFKAYPTLSDPGLFISMIALFPETYTYLRYPLVSTLLHLHAALLMPLFHHLWLGSGTGNANFYYASTLVFACANGATVIDCMWAGLRVAIGEEREGWVVTQQ